ncbi:MAG: spore germination protein GerA family, partial [Oscillospiraceae bacterium]|nr:spore germination protein GerA family [Oscillospiraceae bacterium]
MFKESNKKESVLVEPTGKPDLNGFSLSKYLEANIQMISTIFEDDDTIIVRNFQNQKNKDVSCCIFFIDGMINNSIINEYIIQPIVSNKMLAQSDNTLGEIKGQVITCNDVKQSQDLSEIMQSILYGDTILFVDGFKDALIINSKGWEYRAVEEPDTEKSLRGPREGFNESILLSTSLIRRKIRTSDLKFKFRNIGTRSNTQVCICYLKSLAD